MLLGRLIKDDGGSELIAADEFDKAHYRALSEAGRVRCPDCEARLIHVSGVSDADDLPARFAVKAIPAQGNTQLRVPHWRSRGIEDHAPGCDYRNDPHIAEHVTNFKDALLEGRPIRININFAIGFEGLRNRFNAAAGDPNSGLWSLEAWEKQNPDAIGVPARDVTDILHYLQTAKELKGQDGLKQLFFHNQLAVQSCARFVVSESTSRVERVVNDIYRRWRDSRTNSQFYGDTPRLFLFRASQRQKEKARETTDSDLWGQQFIISTPMTYPVKLGLDSHTYNVTNQTMLDKGDQLWVIATPKMSKTQLTDMGRKLAGQPNGLSGKPLFLTATIETRGAMGVVGSELGRRGQTPDANPPRQLDIFTDTRTPPPAHRRRKGHDALTAR